MRRKRYQPSTKMNPSFVLNITSMTDMFTILLVFLLQTYSTADIQVLPDKGMNLPLSTAMSNPVKAVQVSLAKEGIKIEERTIASLSNSAFDKKDIDPNDSNFILPLFKELDQLMKTEQAKKDANDPKFNQAILDGKILLKADSSFDYGSLRKVMYTASMAGFPKLKLATVVGD